VNVQVVGGRTSRVGVAGFTLGGGLFGYSWIPHHKELINYLRIFMESELIRFGSRHGDRILACQIGWKRGYGNKGFRSSRFRGW
jgi:hypothetical protein